MSGAAKKIMVRVITKRMSGGESFDNIIADYPKLTLSEVNELRKAVGLS